MGAAMNLTPATDELALTPERASHELAWAELGSVELAGAVYAVAVPADVLARAAAPSPLGAPAALAQVVAAVRSAAPSPLGMPAVLAAGVRQAWSSVPTLLGSPAIYAKFGEANEARVQVPGPLGAPAAVAQPVLAGWVVLPGPLGAAAVLAQQPVHGRAAVPGVLGAPAVVARMPTLATAAAPTMLGAARVLAYHDFTAGLGDAVTRYVLDLTTPTGTVRVPMSSWQATLQTGRSNYVQAVVPAVGEWVGAINTATAFAVVRRAELPDDTAVEVVMATAPVQQAQFSRGPGRYTCVLSGYSPGFAVEVDPPALYDRELAGVRSVSSGSGGLRVRCAIDWLLRPGHRAFFEGQPFVAAYINYYVSMGAGSGDAYMDVGERAVA